MSVPRGRWVVVDEDIDPTDLFDVMWLRLHFQGTQSRCFFHQSQGRNDSRSPGTDVPGSPRDANRPVAGEDLPRRETGAL
jgi:hypothetical protein